jgi:hypothetical protein
MAADTPLLELRDQLAHVATAMLSVMPALLWPSVFSAAFVGFMVGLNREIGERRVPVTLAKIGSVFRTEKMDLALWAIGGAFGWLAINHAARILN